MNDYVRLRSRLYRAVRRMPARRAAETADRWTMWARRRFWYLIMAPGRPYS